MRKKLLVGLATGLFVFGMIGIANATSLDRVGLDLLLGSNQILEDFESLSVSEGVQLHDTGVLSSTSTFDGQGPGLVQEGATYQADGGTGNLYWNGHNYYSLISKTLGDAQPGRNIDITYTSPVNAIGFDMRNYTHNGSALGMQGTVSVYDTADILINTTSVNGGFFGWENVSGGGIGRIHIAAVDTSNYILIDDHGYGSAAPVPEPATMLLFGLGLLGLAGVNRRKQ